MSNSSLPNMPGFEVYLQFDSFKEPALRRLRGDDLRETRLKAIENLNKYNLSTALVMTLQKGLNDDEIGDVIQFGFKQKCVRGVTLQPIQAAGRLGSFDPSTDRITLTEVRQAVLDQSGVFNSEDLLPVPCNPDSLVMGYALKMKNTVVPLTRMIDPDDLLKHGENTIVYERDKKLRGEFIHLFDASKHEEEIPKQLKSLLCCLPGIQAPELSYENVFRVIIMQFQDAYYFDLRVVKKSCVHIVHKDGRIIPFDTMNLFYRDDQEKYLGTLREEIFVKDVR